MAVNFCLPCYSSSITCSSITADGYEVDNLISDDCLALQRGFRVEYFIKPPVDVVMSFSGPIDISHVVLGLKLGSLQTCGIEVLTQYAKEHVHEVGQNEDFQIVARKYDIKAPAICFKNRCYQPRSHLTNISMPHSGNMILEYFQVSRYHGVLSSVGRLKVRLTRTLGSSAPGLSFFQVWGQPARHCDFSTAQPTVSSGSMPTPSLKIKPHGDKRNLSSTSNIKVKPFMERKEDQEIDVNVPPEFIDPITCELMTLPFMLPSGHTVDQVTLEKCNESQCSWGHLPNDPFTGLPFSSDHQPVFNPALKSRIDKFLLENGQHLKVPRTVGSKKSSKRLQHNFGLLNFERQAKPLENDAKKQEKQVISKTACLEPLNCGLMSVKDCKRSVSIETFSTNEMPSRLKQAKLNLEPAFDDTKSFHINNAKLEEEPEVLSKVDVSHEMQLALSLNSAIKDTLGNRKPLFKPTVSIAQTVTKCVSCFLANTSLYCLPCSHILCRVCLIETDKCVLCQKEFYSNDVIRVYQ